MSRYLSMLLLVAAGLVFSFPGNAQAGKYKIDSAHTSVHFKVKHMMVAWTRGEFTDVSGTIDLDRDALENSSAEIVIAIDSITTDNDKRDTHLKSGDFFLAKKFPEMTFVSTGVENIEEDGFQMAGELTIRGVTQDVVLDVDGPYGPIRNPMGQWVTGFHAETIIDRTEFGLDWNMPVDSGAVVGDDVHIEIDIELIGK